MSGALWVMISLMIYTISKFHYLQVTVGTKYFFVHVHFHLCYEPLLSSDEVYIYVHFFALYGLSML